MKKAVISLLLLAGLTAQSWAQTPEKFWIGGSFGVNTSNNDLLYQQYEEPTSNSSDGRSFSIQPELGYAFSDRWAVGIRLGFTQDKLERQNFSSTPTDNYDYGDESKIFEVAPFVRYTWLNWKKFSVFVDGGLSYVRTKEEDNNIYDENNFLIADNTSNRYGIFLQPGFSLQLSPCIALNGRLSNFLSVSYMQREGTQTGEGSYLDSSTDADGFATGLNSPFSMSNYMVGFTFSF